VPVHFEGDPELRPHAVRGGHEQGLGKPFPVHGDNASEAADIHSDLFAERGFRQGSNVVNEAVRRLDVHTCFFVSLGGLHLNTFRVPCIVKKKP